MKKGQICLTMIVAMTATFAVQAAEDSGRMTNTLGMEFVKIPAGAFMMGSPENEVKRERWNNDEQLHFVKIDEPFEMQVTEVTQAQWYKVMGHNLSAFARREDCSKTFVPAEKNNEVALCPNNPVEFVRWHDVQKFVEEVNRTSNDGYKYRLPTEEEWEYAARAGTQTAYYWGDSSSLIDEYAWHAGNSNHQTHEVGKLKPNGFGLWDMLGNVREWTSDWYKAYPNGQWKPTSNHGGYSPDHYRVSRGSAWNNYAKDCRSADRDVNDPNDGWDFDLGLRLVRTKLSAHAGNDNGNKDNAVHSLNDIANSEVSSGSSELNFNSGAQNSITGEGMSSCSIYPGTRSCKVCLTFYSCKTYHIYENGCSVSCQEGYTAQCAGAYFTSECGGYYHGKCYCEKN